MNKQNVKISVVVPTYNRPDLLEKLLWTISLQTHPADEVIVVNDGSVDKDAYLKLIDRFESNLSIKYIYLDESKGAPNARNVGLSLAKFDFVCFVDDDDYWANEKLENQLNQVNDDIDLVYSWAKVVDESGKVISLMSKSYEGNVMKNILSGCFIPSPTVMVRRCVINRRNGFDITFSSCQDWDMWTNIILDGGRVAVSKNYDAFYLKHQRGSIGVSSKSLSGYASYYKKYMMQAILNMHVGFVLAALKFFLRRPKLLL